MPNNLTKNDLLGEYLRLVRELQAIPVVSNNQESNNRFNPAYLAKRTEVDKAWARLLAWAPRF